MRTALKLAVVAGLAGLGSGCMTESRRQADGLTDGAGDAIAANTVMQMVDPWPYGVQDTRLQVPADRGTSASSPDGSASAKPSQTTGSSSN
ncbi:MAG: hypothetical protein KF810_03625 [Rhizobiaceae bacterium]|nr:hypothetical protein [Rhizobiaceae bacterium]